MGFSYRRVHLKIRNPDKGEKEFEEFSIKNSLYTEQIYNIKENILNYIIYFEINNYNLDRGYVELEDLIEKKLYNSLKLNNETLEVQVFFDSTFITKFLISSYNYDVVFSNEDYIDGIFKLIKNKGKPIGVLNLQSYPNFIKEENYKCF